MCFLSGVDKWVRVERHKAALAAGLREGLVWTSVLGEDRHLDYGVPTVCTASLALVALSLPWSPRSAPAAPQPSPSHDPQHPHSGLILATSHCWASRWSVQRGAQGRPCSELTAGLDCLGASLQKEARAQPPGDLNQLPIPDRRRPRHCTTCDPTSGTSQSLISAEAACPSLTPAVSGKEGRSQVCLSSHLD